MLKFIYCTNSDYYSLEVINLVAISQYQSSQFLSILGFRVRDQETGFESHAIAIGGG